jgi:hypothetical protein
LRTGETYEMGRFMVRVGRRKTGVCQWCGVEDETVKHVFEECGGRGLRGLRERTGILEGESVLLALEEDVSRAKAIEYHNKALELLELL